MSKSETTVTITHSYGLHLRAAGTLAQKASSFDAEITLTMNTLTANAKSIMSVLALLLLRGERFLPSKPKVKTQTTQSPP